MSKYHIYTIFLLFLLLLLPGLPCPLHSFLNLITSYSLIITLYACIYIYTHIQKYNLMSPFNNSHMDVIRADPLELDNLSGGSSLEILFLLHLAPIVYSSSKGRVL